MQHSSTAYVPSSFILLPCAKPSSHFTKRIYSLAQVPPVVWFHHFRLMLRVHLADHPPQDSPVHSFGIHYSNPSSTKLLPLTRASSVEYITLSSIVFGLYNTRHGSARTPWSYGACRPPIAHCPPTQSIRIDATHEYVRPFPIYTTIQCGLYNWVSRC